MSDTKMLQMVLDGQTSIRKEIKDNRTEIKKNGKRIDKLGMQVAELEDDAPTIEDHENLEKRVNKLELHTASN